MTLKTLTAAGAMLGLMATGAYAQSCGPEGQVISILANDFPAIHAVADQAEENCGAQAAEFKRNHTTEARDIMNAALTPNPSEYTSVIVANSTLTQLMNDGLVRPLNEYVEKYGENLRPNQLITVGGNVMAVAFMANSQHLYVRTDILEQVGITEIPSTYEDVLAAAEAIRAAGIMEHPLVMNMQVGWNIAESFNMMYLGHGGAFFEPGTAIPAINNETGVAALEMLSALTEYANPDYLSQASNETQAVWEAGQAALGIMWGSRGSVIIDEEGAAPGVSENTVLARMPTVAGLEIPAATLWWDGFTISTNVDDAAAEATFAALASALTPEMVAANNDDAVWILEGFTPGPAAAGVAETAMGGAKPYPMFPQMNLMHNALGNELADYLQGSETAEQALADIEASYRTTASEAGFLQ
jgi:multiple sugar transport system substrate-binding protein